jgi:protein SCO1
MGGPSLKKRFSLAGLGAVLLTLAGTGCGGDKTAKFDRPLSRSGLAGIEAEEPRPKPDLRLTTTEGKPFSLRRDTEGYLTLLFFGYTNCPDVCPLHMANIAAVLHKLPKSVVDQVRVVVVTTDPGRDTPQALRSWLDKFDRRFIGLIGSQSELYAAEEQAGVMPTVPDEPDSAGHYTMAHGSAVMAFTRDNFLRAVYPSGTGQLEWAHDIPVLLTLGDRATPGSAGSAESLR